MIPYLEINVKYVINKNMKTMLIQGPQAVGKTILIEILRPDIEIVSFEKCISIEKQELFNIMLNTLDGNILIIDEAYPCIEMKAIKKWFEPYDGLLIFISNSEMSAFENYQFDNIFNNYNNIQA